MLKYVELGFLLSKGGHGIKKDMKEAARWYRMAVSGFAQCHRTKPTVADQPRIEQYVWVGMGVEGTSSIHLTDSILTVAGQIHVII